MSDLIAPLSNDPNTALEIASEWAPYLAQLAERFGPDIERQGAETAFTAALEEIRTIPPDLDPEEAMTRLRQAKRLGHATIAALDLAGQDSLPVVTEKLTELAEVSVAAALRMALFQHNAPTDGLFVLALGKMGARELNYSSDVDLVAFFDPDRFRPEAGEVTEIAAKVIKTLVRLLEYQTADGYVFRTDFRLRPDPRSTPMAISTLRAFNYYEALGQNWERMAWIKASFVAGDREAGDQFLDEMQHFVWRQHLDYWAIADVHAIKAMINTKAGSSNSEAWSDIKLGPGGIREIEFFVQTQQIILGGRIPSLRTKGTLAGLKALVEEGAVPPETQDALSKAYHFLRNFEHRIQMLADEQTHRIPSSSERREAVARLCGYDDWNGLLKTLDQIRTSVHASYRNLFAEEDKKRQTAIDGNLVFAGVDADPGTLETLSKLGFRDPGVLIETVRHWHRGSISATRSPRGRELLTALLPEALNAMSNTGEPDVAFGLFSRFLAGLTSGVQTLSMLISAPRLLDDLIATLALAPQIGATLAKNASLLECLVSERVRTPPPLLEGISDFETKLDVFRKWHAEESFLIGHRLLHRQLAARDAATAWSDLAELSIRNMAAAAQAETERRFGPPRGKWIIVALGKLGGRELTAHSDLDILVIFDREEFDEAQSWFTRFTQRLITAISADTAAGSLYETDMRLRPSGRAGPVATSIEAFESYHCNDAWTWELMALTRFRVVAGDAQLGARAYNLAERMISNPRQPDSIDADVLDMRQRLSRDKPPKSSWDLKQRSGGIVDLEFIVQHAMLQARDAACWHPAIADAIDALETKNVLNAEEAETLRIGRDRLQALQQIQRLAHGAEASESPASDGLKERLARAIGCSDFSQAEQQLSATCDAIAALRCKRIGPLATES
ncbi:MAG: bifunctional [glutamine synthetase] adenylyltransferase/[glutamine synthetase]-adenylyl-L-tyrosine phosphorylase [Pseudomonadota bacterium]